MITISIADQTLEYQGKIYSISSAKNGVGEVEGSYCTPTGQFKISEKIGDNLEVGSVLVARAPTGEIYSPALLAKHPDRDWILTRILWLEGAEAHNQNTKEIASITFRQVRSVESTRFRIRKKLNLTASESLYGFLENL